MTTAKIGWSSRSAVFKAQRGMTRNWPNRPLNPARYPRTLVFAMKAVFAMFAGLLSLVGVSGYPLEPHSHNMSEAAVKFISDAKSAVPAAPHFVIYSDAPVSGETGPPPVSQIQVCGKTRWSTLSH